MADSTPKGKCQHSNTFWSSLFPYEHNWNRRRKSSNRKMHSNTERNRCARKSANTQIRSTFQGQKLAAFTQARNEAAKTMGDCIRHLMASAWKKRSSEVAGSARANADWLKLEISRLCWQENRAANVAPQQRYCRSRRTRMLSLSCARCFVALWFAVLWLSRGVSALFPIWKIRENHILSVLVWIPSIMFMFRILYIFLNDVRHPPAHCPPLLTSHICIQLCEDLPQGSNQSKHTFKSTSSWQTRHSSSRARRRWVHEETVICASFSMYVSLCVAYSLCVCVWCAHSLRILFRLLLSLRLLVRLCLLLVLAPPYEAAMPVSSSALNVTSLLLN